jgi:4-hydroxy-4-methyl-2-oxoglutarate aldolase
MANKASVTISRNFTRPAPEIVRPFLVPTGYITDVQGRRGALDCSIKPIFEFPAFAGPAVTVKTVPDDNLAVFAALEVMQPGDVLVIAIDGWTGSALFGDLIAGMFKNIGIAAVVTDGAVRDVTGLEQVGLPVYARGLTANSSQKNGPGAVGLEISIGSVIIRPGDIMIGDRDGVSVVPQEIIPDAIEKMKAVSERERKMEAGIAEGMTMPDWVKQFLASDRVKYID